PRLPDDPGDRSGHGSRVCGREPARRRRLLAARPADQDHRSAGMSAVAVTSPRARRRRLLRKRFLRRPVGVASLVLILGLIVTALLAPVIATHTASETVFDP